VVVPVVLPAALVGAAAAAPHHVVALTGRERHPVDACRHELTSRYRGGRETWGTPARGLGPRPPGEPVDEDADDPDPPLLRDVPDARAERLPRLPSLRLGAGAGRVNGVVRGEPHRDLMHRLA